MNRGAAHRRRSSKRTILPATRPEGRTSESKSRDQPQARIGERCPCCPTPLFPGPSPILAGRGRNSSIDQREPQSPYRPRTGSRKPPYARSPRGSSGAAPSHRTTTESGEIGVMAHRILSRRMPCMPRRIPPSEQTTQDPWTHDMLTTPPLSYTPDS
jgi:hypothetical protein